MSSPSAQEAEDYKRLREAFVSDHYGGTVTEINIVTIVAPAGILLWSALQAHYRLFDRYGPLACAIDFLINCGAILFSTTVYSNEPIMLVLLLTLPVFFSFVNTVSQKSADKQKTPRKPSVDDKGKKDDDLQVIDPLPVKPFVTHYRGAMMIITCVCILAVDFKVFPRRFAKTESIGTSLMDLGVGSFVFAAGVVSVRQQLKEANGDAPRTNFIQRFVTSFRHALPLVVLGLIRLYSVKKLNYAEHVTEYGVHWNFFFTLAVIPPFVAIFQTVFRLIPSYAIIAYAISLTQQLCLSYAGLLQWLAFAPRDGLINSNKEGLASIPGYLAIFLAGQDIGMAILQRDQDPNSSEIQNDLWLAQTLGGDDKVTDMKKTHERQSTWLRLAKWSGIWIVIYFFSTGNYGPRLTVSRRFANMAYFVWVCAFNTVQLWIFCTIETLFFPDVYGARHKHTELERAKKATSRILAAFNRNGLAIFLLANLLTGLINMSLRTIEMARIPAMVVLIGYLAVLSAVALTLDRYNVSIKL
ncbi:GPI-anchored wall transfer protein 1 [Myriangium duriaei CBS 260.36]|uniref:GPI-anchored wall transfer protein n=1 Tax=Myriangium duriaei CBS 260.36 TaxID=1168546 RepID=A0A9P4MJG0_9PEZI|nr:GPI-anchored wall transfer protein 1 [Myriangium duriaei CBS 260.36]